MVEKQGREPNSMEHKKTKNNFLVVDCCINNNVENGFFLINVFFYKRYKMMDHAPCAFMNFFTAFPCSD